MPNKKRLSKEHCSAISRGLRQYWQKAKRKGHRAMVKTIHAVDQQEKNRNSVTRKVHRVVRTPVVRVKSVRRAVVRGYHAVNRRIDRYR